MAEAHNRALLLTLRDGDLIEIPRRFNIYSHWAVYIGDGKVIHLTTDSFHISAKSGLSFDNPRVEEAELILVAGNSEAKLNNSNDAKKTPLEPAKIVQNAKDHLGEKEYNLLTHNCEHFATWCRYGVEWSQQVVDDLIAAGVLVVIGVFVATVVKTAEEPRKKEQKEKN